MPSHARHSKRKRNIPKNLHWRKNASTHNKTKQSPPQAPPELDAILGYGTQYSFPFFTRGVVSRVKNLFGHKTQ
jgi:hypothetical protein